MIACSCRPFIRVDRVWKVANTYVLSKPVDYFQECRVYVGQSYGRKIGRAKDVLNIMDQHKKRKAATPVWMPLCTQSSSYEGCLAKDVKIQPENLEEEVNCIEKSEVRVQVQELHCSPSGPVLDVQDLEKECETVSELAESLSSGALKCSDQDVALEENKIKEDNAFVINSDVSVDLVRETERHSISIELAASLIRFIKGKGGSTQKQIEGEMGVKIVFPSSKEEDSIVIQGISLESVTKASQRIQEIIEQAVKSPNLDYSHFVSLPLAIHPELVDKLINFQNSVLEISGTSQDQNLESDSNEENFDDGKDKDDQLDGRQDVAVKLKVEDDNRHVKVEMKTTSFVSYPPKASNYSTLSDLGIDSSIFIKPKTFHLTVLMLKLWNKERIAAATEVLQRISSKVMDALEGRPVSVRLKGLECMRGPLAKARVLYAPVEEIGGEGRLLRACQVIVDAYAEAGLVLEKDAQQKLKLHATVMNARHRKRKIRTKKYDSFDARGIVKQYGSEEWGEYLICEAHLSQRFKFGDNGYYHCCGSIPFPKNMQVE